MLHAKAVVIDDELALAGSANLDARSLFLNYELMVAFYEPADVRRFAAWIDGERRRAALPAARAGADPRPRRRPRALARVPALKSRVPAQGDVDGVNGVEVEKRRLTTSSPAFDRTCRPIGCTLAV